jgi:hypothetical protein
MESVALGDLLTPEQLNQVVALAGGTQDDMDFTQKAKTYLRTIESELATKGVIPDYLAYVLTAALPQLRAEFARLNALN